MNPKRKGLAPLETLGGGLILPPWLEENRAGIENALPSLAER
ncbi:MAG: hypothetical protein ABI601_14360 [bacterium]